ncbi:hypothetical protein B296_00000736 [Ensete ventricosum]|uniref:3'-5' exonuclease domain-containing protein n=1 Tax=Ensete ventricosum TaxID=4639 RepID=A0A427BC76_ENSVE|nr:hypothetical protein B296_00000736 [Ensete ventricosum]
MNSTERILIAGSFVTVTVTYAASTVVAQLRALRSAKSGNSKLVVGLDVEWLSHDDRNAKVALLQLCSGTHCLIVQLHHLDYIPTELLHFLADPTVDFVGVGITNDAHKLREDYGWGVGNAVELAPLAAKKKGPFGGQGLADLSRAVVGITIDKPSRSACVDWTLKHLSHDHIVYAATDAYVSYLIGEKLLAN